MRVRAERPSREKEKRVRTKSGRSKKVK